MQALFEYFLMLARLKNNKQAENIKYIAGSYHADLTSQRQSRPTRRMAK